MTSFGGDFRSVPLPAGLVFVGAFDLDAMRRR